VGVVGEATAAATAVAELAAGGTEAVSVAGFARASKNPRTVRAQVRDRRPVGAGRHLPGRQPCGRRMMHGDGQAIDLQLSPPFSRLMACSHGGRLAVRSSLVPRLIRCDPRWPWSIACHPSSTWSDNSARMLYD
jgi:hypothetical protein